VLPYLALIARAPQQRAQSWQGHIQTVCAPHDCQLASHLAGFSARDWTKLAEAKALERVDSELKAIALPTKAENAVDTVQDADPSKVLEDDDICD